jgi:hypothetical protein
VLMTVFWTFVYLSFFSAGIMLVLQIQHFGLYPLVGKETFAAYISANNRAAVFPAILAALVLTLLSIVLLFLRPAFFSLSEAVICVALNFTNLISTMIWQGPLHQTLSRVGYDERLVKRLIRTNWVRTFALLLQSFIAYGALLRFKV